MMIKRLTISNAVVKFISLRTCPRVSRCLGTGDQTPAQILGSGDSIKIGDSIQPVKLAYSSYESTKPTSNPIEWPVIIMHGLLGSKANWNAMSKMLHSKTKRKVFAVDARNHGDSPHTDEITYNHLAEDLRALMNDLAIKRATFIGHSMGGRAVMLLGLRYPELVEKLIVVDISPVNVSPSLSTMPKYFDAMKSVKLEGNIPLSKARKIADEQLATHVPDVGTRQFLLTNLVESEGGQYKWRINLDSIAKNFPNIASFPFVGTSCPVPTLFIAGENSDYIRVEDHSQIKEIFPAAKFVTVSGAGHWVHADKPNELLSILQDFIQNGSVSS